MDRLFNRCFAFFKCLTTKTKKGLSLLLCAVLLLVASSPFAVKAQAASGFCGPNLTWDYNESTGVLTISGTGEMYDYTNSIFETEAPWGTYYKVIKAVVIEQGVTTIGCRAFLNCESIATVSIGNSVTSIGDYSFEGCGSIDTNIGYAAFSWCTELEKITIGSGVMKIEKGAFDSCSKFTDVYYNGKRADWEDITIEELFNDPLLNAKIHCLDDPCEHNYTSAVTREPTCQLEGERTFTCSKCGGTYTEPIAKKAHTPGGWETVKEPTETETGEQIRKCTACGEAVDTKVLPKVEHLKSVQLNNMTVSFKGTAVLDPVINPAEGNYEVSYQSSNANVVRVNEKTGEFYGAKKGAATITCTVKNLDTGFTVKDTCKVTVKYTAVQWLIRIFLFGWIWYK